MFVHLYLVAYPSLALAVEEDHIVTMDLCMLVTVRFATVKLVAAIIERLQ
jgi:hypothetical protein